MINLLKFEWRKLWQQKSLYIIFGIGLVSIIFFMLLGKVVLDVFNVSPSATESMLIVLPNSGFVSLLGIYLVLFACGDHSQHTIKNIYARGYSRSAVYFSKYLVSLGVVLVMALFYIAFGFIFALILGGKATSMENCLWGNLALQFLVVVGIHGLYFGLSMMFGKIAPSLAMTLVGIELIIMLVNSLFSLAKVDFDLTQYYLEVILNNLTAEPLSQANLIRAIVMPVCYVIVFIGGGWLINQHRDV